MGSRGGCSYIFAWQANLYSCCGVQAAQVRKSSYVPDPGVQYDPDSYNSCTVYAGTIVRQVSTAQRQDQRNRAVVHHCPLSVLALPLHGSMCQSFNKML